MTPQPNRDQQLQARLFAALANPACVDDGKRVTAIETHISYVLLTGTYAYKIKKAVDFGFLDFTTLAARRFFCEEELRLNRRLAPELYLAIVPITGSIEAPRMGGDGPVLDYAVKMREFPQDALASRLLARGELGTGDIDALAKAVARFHGAIEVAATGLCFGAPERVYRTAQDNFHALRPLVDDPAERATIDGLATWTEREYGARSATLLRRLEEGFVRECHGDLHLGNIARIDGALTIFDCVEFNPGFRWIDVMSEVAFMLMDLDCRGHAELARRFANAYLECTGDYGGVAVLRFYLVYRALVRAKVARLRAAQLGSGVAQRAALDEYRDHLCLARDYAESAHPAIVITHGLSGSGKTTLSQALLETIGAVRVRSDVERKRLHEADAGGRHGIDEGLYANAITEATYRHLADASRAILAGGLVALADAAFLERWQRDLFRDLAGKLGVPFAIIDFAASVATLRERVALRSEAGTDASDADLAVLEHQLDTEERLAADEMRDVVRYDADAPLERARSRDAWRIVQERIAGSPIDRLRANGVGIVGSC